MRKGVSALVGVVLKRNDLWKAVRVRVMHMELDKHLLTYFNRRQHIWASEPEAKCKDGDIVLIKPMEEPQSDRVTHFVSETVFEVGNTIDPITGRRCRGPEFADTMKYTGVKNESTN